MKALGLLPFILISLAFSSISWAEGGLMLKEVQIKKLKENIVKNPENINSRRFLSRHYFNKKKWADVIEVLAPVAENLPTKELHTLTYAYLNSKNIREAESIIRIPLSGKQVSMESYLIAAEVYAAKSRYSNYSSVAQPSKDMLFEILKTAQQSYPTSYKVYDTWIGYLIEFVPHYQFEALKVLDDMMQSKLELKDKHYSWLCKFNHLSGFTKQTKESCTLAIKKDSSNPANYIFLGQTHINTGEKDKGLRMLASVGKKFSQSEEALWATGTAHYDNKNLQEAYSYFKKAIKHPDVKPRDFLGYAKTAFELKKYSEALKAFDKHCRMTKILDHEFRRASGLLKSASYWRNQYRRKMMNCQEK